MKPDSDQTSFRSVVYIFRTLLPLTNLHIVQQLTFQLNSYCLLDGTVIKVGSDTTSIVL